MTADVIPALVDDTRGRALGFRLLGPICGVIILAPYD
jgi:hypothetical protein